MEACEHLKENLTLYVHGALDPDTGQEVKDHLELCAGCRHEWQRLSSMLEKLKEISDKPELSTTEVKSLVVDITRKLNLKQKQPWWRQYPDFRSWRLIPAVATACILIITIAIIGYVNLNETNGIAPVSLNQNEELMLSDKDLELLDNLELLREMDAIQKLSRVVDPKGETDSQREIDSDTRGMRQDAYRQFFV
jgi:hypothetical protein